MHNKTFLASLVIILQMAVIGVFVHCCWVLGQHKSLYEEVEEFEAVKVECVHREKSTYRTVKSKLTLYTNTYEYVVDGVTITKVESGERKPGESKYMYYNPNNPEILSEYKSYSDAIKSLSGWIVLASFIQGVIIVLIIRAVKTSLGIEPKEKIVKPKKVVGYVVKDEYDFLNDEPLENNNEKDN
ncbi:MAG: hypothetical protein IKJ73_08550 [Lachnospiraceae bacterium]|nr:hypothetical protein [Lachnospiraceae bacterium]